jgi:Bacterial Ig domain
VNPKAVTDNYSTTSGSPIILQPLTLDTAGMSLLSINGTTITPGTAQTISVTNGNITISASGIITFTPNSTFSGIVTIPYVIQNSTGQSATANQSIVVSLSTPVVTPPSSESTQNLTNILPQIGSGSGGAGKLIRTGGTN